MNRLLSKTSSLEGLRVLVRLDLDLPLEDGEFDTTRLDNGISTLKMVLAKGASMVTVIGHRGRPDGKTKKALSLKPIGELLLSKLTANQAEKVVVLENLRFDAEEEACSATYAALLAKDQDVYVYDAFAVAHRAHSSVVEVPKLLPTLYGLQFEVELEGLKHIMPKKAKRPFIVLMGGAKLETKMPMIEAFRKKADVILVGGKLALEMKNLEKTTTNRKIIVGELREDTKDLTPEAVDQFSRFIAAAKTILWNGPLGKIEDEDARAGTRAIAKHLAGSRGYVVAAGGDTEAALSLLRIKKGISFVSSGGGATLEYVISETLPGIEAIEKSAEFKAPQKSRQ